MTELGRVREIVRYPVKSMAGVPAESAFLGWHGLEGDRRFAFRRLAADAVTMRDERCAMVNIDPETAARDARVMKTVVRLNDNDAGVYATVVRTGTIRVGDRVRVLPHGLT